MSEETREGSGLGFDALFRGTAFGLDENPGDEEGSAVARIAGSIGRAIVNGEIAPGDDLNSVELSRRFRVSRTPVREALLLLARQGLVQIEPRRRPRVARFELEETRAIYELRATLLAMVFELLVRRATDEDIERLKARFAPMDDAARKGDLERYFWANVALHDLAADLSGNRALKEVLDPLRLKTLRLRRFGLGLPGRLQRSRDDHVRLLAACSERDAALAAALIRSIVTTAYEAIAQDAVAPPPPTKRRRCA